VENLLLTAPLEGWIAPLTEVPDPVFAEKMLGDGLAIDPTGTALCAPCDGIVTSVHRARHAVSLRATNGAEILMHVGLDTVGLEGKGFEVVVRDGQAVKAGEVLLRFDLALLSSRARSLITPILIVNRDDFEIVRRVQDREARVGDELMELKPVARAAPEDVKAADPLERTIIVPLAHGLHARPAAKIAHVARKHSAVVTLFAEDRNANATSAVAIMALGVSKGQPLRLKGEGQDAAAAVAEIAALIQSGMGEGPKPPKPAVATVAAPAQRAAEPGVVRGLCAAPGLAIGQAYGFVHHTPKYSKAATAPVFEGSEITRAIVTLGDRLKKASSGADPTRRGILDAHLALLNDPGWTTQALALTARGKSAGEACHLALHDAMESLRQSKDPMIQQRAGDLLDLEQQLLQILAGERERQTNLPTNAIVLADDLLPSELMSLDAGRMVGLCTSKGGPTSHVAILAAALGLPSIVATGTDLASIADGTTLLLDADDAALHVAPGADVLADAANRIAARRLQRMEEKIADSQPCKTLDGQRIEVFANIGTLQEAETALSLGAEGCGLLRTELLFLDRETPPDEAEQAREYQKIASAFGGKPLIVRTLDIGGDKPAPYLEIPHEHNPALGLRGIRVGLWKPELLDTQLRAILRVQPVGVCRIMVPMVASVDELRAVRARLAALASSLGIREPVSLGIMVETPAAAVTTDLLAAEADFFSVGTNDLTQYVLAMDRINQHVAANVDAFHPAVLRMIDLTCRGAARHGRPVGVCGGLASDPVAAPVLVGLGVTELSCTPPAVSAVKAAIRRVDLETCRKLAAAALERTSPRDVRELLSSSAPPRS